MLLGCASTPQQSSDGGPIVAGDRLMIAFTNRDVSHVPDVVDAKGEISLPFAGKLRVAGMSLHQAAQAIQMEYRLSCFRDPIKVSLSRL
jgi:protein involved in polysaccharide export with SLBB domain